MAYGGVLGSLARAGLAGKVPWAVLGGLGGHRRRNSRSLRTIVRACLSSKSRRLRGPNGFDSRLSRARLLARVDGVVGVEEATKRRLASSLLPVPLVIEGHPWSPLVLCLRLLVLLLLALLLVVSPLLAMMSRPRSHRQLRSIELEGNRLGRSPLRPRPQTRPRRQATVLTRHQSPVYMAPGAGYPTLSSQEHREVVVVPEDPALTTA